MENYNLDYFIRKFSLIPENMWNVGRQFSEDGTRCALGHCGGSHSYTEEYKGLLNLFDGISLNIIKNVSHNIYSGNRVNYSTGVIAAINNGETAEYQQSTPKQRILAALYDIKAKLEPEIKERIVYVSIDKEVLQELELCEN